MIKLVFVSTRGHSVHHTQNKIIFCRNRYDRSLFQINSKNLFGQSCLAICIIFDNCEFQVFTLKMWGKFLILELMLYFYR
jgi:hypothetical protein